MSVGPRSTPHMVEQGVYSLTEVWSRHEAVRGDPGNRRRKGKRNCMWSGEHTVDTEAPAAAMWTRWTQVALWSADAPTVD